MSIKFPDFQVLVSRSELAPRLNSREGEQTGAAGRMTPQVSQEFEIRRRRVAHSRAKDKVRRKEEEEGRGRQGRRGQEQAGDKRRSQQRRRIDLRA